MEHEGLLFGGPDRPKAKKTISLRTYVATVVGFVTSWFLLGLGLGYGRSRLPSWRYWDAYSATSEYTRLWPQNLDFVPVERLINTTNLGHKGNFVMTENMPREYVLNITQALAAPDGFTKPMILVNGQSPGPKIEANSGDTIRVTVNNQMVATSTSIHFHGINQRNSTLMDGVAGVTQCPIPPGQSYTYEFRCVEQRGTFWYHAHTGIQYTDGLFGPIVIHDPEEKIPLVDDEKIIFMGDHYHTYAGLILSSYLQPSSVWSPTIPGVEPLPDNILLNGQHTTDCTIASTTWPDAPSLPTTDGAVPTCTNGSLSRTPIAANQTVRLRLINHSAFFSLWFSIDNHTLTLVELDGTEIVPQPGLRGVYLNIGQRVSVLVTADQTPGHYLMRATLPQTCFLPYAPYTSARLAAVGYQGRGLLAYEDAGVDPAAPPLGIAGNTSNPYGVDTNGGRGSVWEGCDDMGFDVPVPVREMAAVPVSVRNMWTVQFQFQQAGAVNRIFINRTSWLPLDGDAQIWEALDQMPFSEGQGGSYNNWKFPWDQQVLLLPDADQGVQIVINSLDGMEHPFHLHGHTFQIVGWGPGQFEQGSNATTWRLANPMRRDTVTVPAQHHVVIRFMADNPGLWALHCHVAWHMEAGMFVSFLERPDDLEALINDMDDGGSRDKAKTFCAKRHSP